MTTKVSPTKLKPLSDRVLVKQEKLEVTSGGIVLPETAQEAPQWGTVVQTGPGKTLENGERLPITVKVGDKVLFGKYSGTKVKIEDTEYLFMREEDILGMVEA